MMESGRGEMSWKENKQREETGRKRKQVVVETGRKGSRSGMRQKQKQVEVETARGNKRRIGKQVEREARAR